MHNTLKPKRKKERERERERGIEREREREIGRKKKVVVYKITINTLHNFTSSTIILVFY